MNVPGAFEIRSAVGSAPSAVEAGRPCDAPPRRGREATRSDRPAREGHRSKPRPDPLGAASLDTFGGLLDVSPDELRRARHLFTLLGDPGRRTILERLSRRPQKPGTALPGATGMDGEDIYHRLRSLRWGHVLTKDRHQIYRVDPASLECARKYVDVLIVVASRTARSLPNDH